MGCDIHLFVEYKITGENKEFDYWKCWMCQEIEISRSYQLFGLMGEQFRKIVEPIIAARGIPKDGMSIEVEFEINSWQGDGHSHSWLSLNELKNVLFVHPDLELRALVAAMEVLETYHETRIVFFFDN